jgi:histidinol-phosphatase (PHP family)
MEINTSGRNKVIPEVNPCPIMLREMRCREIPVVIGADAHEPERVGADFLTALDLAEAAGYRCVSQFRERRRHDVPISAAREALSRAADRAPGLGSSPNAAQRGWARQP